MARRQQELKSVISVYGRADKSLDALARKIDSFGSKVGKAGSTISLLTAPVIAAGTASGKLFTDYDDILRKIEAAGGYTQKQMDLVDAAARQAGADTRYMATDAGQAFLDLTQAGVSLESSLSTLPVLLNAAAAGDMALSDASDLLISNIYSLGKSFDELDTSAYMDKVVTAANATNTTVQELMEGVSKIGNVGQLFAGGESELLAFLGLLANLNMKGTVGGVNARNMIISLLAPTNKAADLMNALQISEEEMGEALEDISLTDSAAAIKRLGLETVDASGKVRPMVDILTDLKAATDNLADDEKANVLYSIFGKRTYPAVAGLLELLGEYPELLGKIDSAMGSTKKRADILEGGIGGATRRVSSAIQELGLSVGEAASDKAIEWMDTIRGLALDAAGFVKSLDPETVNTVMDVLGGLAVAGPGLVIAEKAIHGIGGVLRMLGTPGGAAALGVGVISALAVAIGSAQDAAARKDLENHFGSMTMDPEALSEVIAGLSTSYETAATNINAYADAIQAAGTNYETYVQQFSGGVLEASLFGTELTDADKQALESYVTAMIGELNTAISTQKIALGEIVSITYDGTSAGDAEKNSAWSEAINALFGEYDAEAQTAGQQLMQTYLDAVADGTIDGAERDAIARATESLSRVMAEIQSYQGDVDKYTVYAKAMNLSYTSWKDAVKLFDEFNAKSDEQTDALFDQLVGTAMANRERGYAISEQLQQAYGVGAYDYDALLLAIAQDRQDQKLDNRLYRDIGASAVGDRGFDTYAQSEAEVDIGQFEALASGIMDGTLTLTDALAQADAIIAEMNNGDAERVTKSVESWAEDMSEALSFEELMAQIQHQKETTGQISAELAELYKDYLVAGLLSGAVTGSGKYGLTMEAGVDDGRRTAFLGGQEIGQESELVITVKMPEDGQEQGAAFAEDVGVGLAENEPELTVKMPEDGQEQGAAFADGVNAGLDASDPELEIVTPGDAVERGRGYSGGYTVGLAENKPELYVDIPGYDEGYSDVQSYIGGAQSALNDADLRLSIKIGSGSSKKKKGYATGGFSDVPAIFGEDGGEWAIPQERTENTRILLRRAAAGSGFAPEEVYPERRAAAALQFTFAPTIYAGNASGVSEALEQQSEKIKKMLDEWMEDRTREMERVSYS